MTTSICPLELAVESLFEKSYALIKIPPEQVKMIDRVFRVGCEFFDASDKLKFAKSSPDILEGYRAIGSELDAATGLPDLCESFSVWRRNMDLELAWRRDLPIYTAMAGLFGIFERHAKDLAALLKKAVSGNPDLSFDMEQLSYFQMNRSRPCHHRRQNIMEAHEDGHLLTLIKPNQSGLQIAPGELVAMPSRERPSGDFRPNSALEPITVGEDELLVFASSPTFYLTGGMVLPLFHRVANTNVQSRQSLMYFLNPQSDMPIYPWIECGAPFDHLDIRAIVDFISGSYGLKPVSTLTTNGATGAEDASL